MFVGLWACKDFNQIPHDWKTEEMKREAETTNVHALVSVCVYVYICEHAKADVRMLPLFAILF